MRKDVKKRGGGKRRAYPGGCILIGQMEVSRQRTHLAVRPYIRHRGKRRRAVNGMQGYSLSLHKTGGSPAMTCLKSLFSPCHCTRLSLSLHKTGGGSAMTILKSLFSPCHCTRLSLSLHKTGGGSAMASLKTLFSSCHCTRLSLSLHPKKFVHELYPDF